MPDNLGVVEQLRESVGTGVVRSEGVRTVHHVLNLGAGVQSTTLYLMAMRGKAPAFDCAIFADTGEEPVAVYEHLQWLGSLGGPPIIVARNRSESLGQDLIAGRNTTGGNFAAIPAFTTLHDGSDVGRTRRQCSKEYKTEPIERAIRRVVCGLQPRRRIPKGVMVHQYFGISLDEAGRATRIYERFHVCEPRQSPFQPHFPLIEKQMTRANCLEWLEAYGVPHTVPRSACVFCPFHSDAEWLAIKQHPRDWTRAVEIDNALRSGAIAARDMRQTMYLHRTCLPLTQIDFHPRVNSKELQLGFGVECEGVCGV
jgi:hypothetical protein